jgi:hypothetical protein
METFGTKMIVFKLDLSEIHFVIEKIIIHNYKCSHLPSLKELVPSVLFASFMVNDCILPP